MPHPRRGLVLGLAGLYLLLLVYASLYPFEGWRWPAGSNLSDLLILAWPPWRDRFDEWANMLGYAPLGALLFLLLVGRGYSLTTALLIAVVLAAGLSYVLEFMQHFIPGRFPSRRDWLNNTVGAIGGAALAWFIQGAGLADAGERLGARWFAPGGSAAILLLAIWPLGLLFPSPVPLGLGHIVPELKLLVEAAVAATPLEAATAEVLASFGTSDAPLSAWREALLVGLGQAAPCLLASVVVRPTWRRRACIAPTAFFVAVASMSVSTALNFGPQHAWGWATQLSLTSMAVSAALCLLLSTAGPRFSAALALVVLTALVVVVAEAPQDPYYAASLSGWEQGRFVRFHGLAQWIGMLWPYAAITWLMMRLTRRN